jgi:hypothetical protein
MPLNETILGFSNRWYTPAVKAATIHELLNGINIKVVTPPYFCATKLEAFANRGKGDFLASHDLEDLITVIDGRAELMEEIFLAPEDVRSYVASQIGLLINNRRFRDALPGYLFPDEASQARIGILFDRLTKIAKLEE